MDKIGKYFADKKFRCLAITLKGHCKETEMALFEDWLEDVDNACKLLRRKGCKKIWIFGHSLGASIALNYATKTEISGLILTCPFVSRLPLIKRFIYIAKRIDKKLPKVYGGTLKKLHCLTNMSFEVVRSFENLGQKDKIEIGEAVFFIHSGKDPMVSLTDSKKLYKKIKTKNKKFLICPKQTHEIIEGIKEKTLKKIEDFIKTNSK